MIGSCGIQVDQTLIPGAAPAQLQTTLCKDERSVHKNVGVIQQGELCGVAAFAQRLQPITGINPNAQTAAPRLAREHGAFRRLLHRFAAGECQTVEQGIVLQITDDLGNGHLPSARGIVRRRIVAAGTGIADDAIVTAHRVTVNGVVDRAVADAALPHIADDFFEGIEILQRVAVHFDIRDVSTVCQRMIRRFELELPESSDGKIHRNMEAVGIVAYSANPVKTKWEGNPTKIKGQNRTD